MGQLLDNGEKKVNLMPQTNEDNIQMNIKISRNKEYSVKYKILKNYNINFQTIYST